jgi:hypothetical protein
VGHLLGFWVPIEIRGRSLVRWKALVKAYMPTFFWIFSFFRRERCIYAQILLGIFGIFPISSTLVGAMPFLTLKS